MFLSRVEFRPVTERSPYFRRMTTADLCARSIGVAHADQASYLAWYQAHTMEWPVHERGWMRTVIAAASYRMREAGLHHMIPSWRFAKVSRKVEMGFPHTLEDVIVWTEAVLDRSFEQQVELAIHEAVHVWQRLNPELARVAHKKSGYEVVALTEKWPNGHFALLRNNPDADEYVWQRAGVTYGSRYRSARPSDLMDVTGEDHPNEEQAYSIARMSK